MVAHWRTAALVAAAAALLACDGVVGIARPQNLRGALEDANRRATRAAGHAWALQHAGLWHHGAGRPSGAAALRADSATSRFRQQSPVRANRHRQAMPGSAWVARGEDTGFLSSVEDEDDDEDEVEDELAAARNQVGSLPLKHSSSHARRDHGSLAASTGGRGGGDVAWGHGTAHRFESHADHQQVSKASRNRPKKVAEVDVAPTSKAEEDLDSGEGDDDQAEGSFEGVDSHSTDSASRSGGDGLADEDEDNDDTEEEEAEDTSEVDRQDQSPSYSMRRQEQDQDTDPGRPNAHRSHHVFRQSHNDWQSHSSRRHSLGDEAPSSGDGGTNRGALPGSTRHSSTGSRSSVPMASRAADGIPDPVYLDSAPAADTFFKQAASRAAELRERAPEEREETLPPTTSSDSGSGRGVPRSAPVGGIEGSAGMRHDAERAIGSMDPTLAFAPPAEPAVDERLDDPASAAAIPSLASEDESQSNFEASLDRDASGMGRGSGGSMGGGAGELESALSGMRLGGGAVDPSGAMDPPAFAG